MKSDLESKTLISNVLYTSMPSEGYDFIAMLLKNNFEKSGFKILANLTLNDLLKGPSLGSPTFIGGLMGLEGSR